MRRSNRLGRFLFLEAGAALLFFGVLVNNPGLHQSGEEALHELAARGYRLPTDEEPVRVYPVQTAGEFSSGHAGGWRPGVITLRPDPQGNFTARTYLRHELMHEASFRTCGGRLPVWADEAAAIHFSGELQAGPAAEPPAPEALDWLRDKIRVKAPLTGESYRLLASLAGEYGWPEPPCAISRELRQLLEGKENNAARETGFSYLVISLLSGRVLQAAGDLAGRYPPGSLLKIPYAASLTSQEPEAIGAELAASDTGKLLARRGNCDLERYRLLISPASASALGKRVGIDDQKLRTEDFWRPYLGERGEDGGFPLEANLPELAMVLRGSLLFSPEMFHGLVTNGETPGTTLFRAGEEEKKLLAMLRAMSKTGTASDAHGNPLAGHLLVVWPAEEPTFMALFRTLGASGAANIHRAARILEPYHSPGGTEYGAVRVRLLSAVPREQWLIREECPQFSIVGANQWRREVSLCGRFRILSSARGGRSERTVAGLLEHSPDERTMVLVTDPETYADAVLSAEAQDLHGEGRKALRAVIVWNGVHGSRRHAESLSLCDTTHCMVFRGEEAAGKPAEKALRSEKNLTEPGLVQLLDEISIAKGLNWLPFAKGGESRWTRTISGSSLRDALHEEQVLDLRRERSRGGEVNIHLFYRENEEAVSCEVFRNFLKLPSCPSTISRDEAQNSWLFTGIGEGHDLGLSVERARILSDAGKSAAEILRDAFR